jgi:hypothetical protein
MTRAYQIAGARTRVTIELKDGSNKVVLVGPTGAFYKSSVSNNKLGNIQNFDSSVKYYSIGDYTFTSKGQEELMGQSSLVQERVDFYENLGRKNPTPSPLPLPVATNKNQLEAKAIELGKRLTAKTGINHSYVSLKELTNGAYGAYYNNGKANIFRIIQGAPVEKLKSASRQSRGNKQISPKAASRAFTRYYKNRSYKSGDKGRARAMARDMCHAKPSSKTTTSSKYRRSPRKFDYPGLDDGSKCSGKLVKQGQVSPKSLEALARGRTTLSNKRSFKAMPQSGGSITKAILDLFR